MPVNLTEVSPEKISPEKILYGYQDAAEALSISPNHLVKLIRENQVKVRRLGRRVLIPREEIERLASRDRAMPGDGAKSASIPDTLDEIKEREKRLRTGEETEWL